MEHNDEDNQTPPHEAIRRRRAGWFTPKPQAQPARMTPDPAPDQPYIDRTVPDKPEPEVDHLAGIPDAYEIVGTNKAFDAPIYRCTRMIGDTQCDFTVVTPARMAGHARSSVHWSNKGVLNNPTSEVEPEACGYRNEHGQQCLVRGTREGVIEHIRLVQKGDSSHHFMPKSEATSPGVDPLSVDQALERRTYELIRQTQRELLRVIEVLDENPNMNETDSRWNLNRMNELRDKLAALKLIVDSTPPIYIAPNVRKTPLIGSI